jgi:tetratricopeptide (TPR) repeat protein
MQEDRTEPIEPYKRKWARKRWIIGGAVVLGAGIVIFFPKKTNRDKSQVTAPTVAVSAQPVEPTPLLSPTAVATLEPVTPTVAPKDTPAPELKKTDDTKFLGMYRRLIPSSLRALQKELLKRKSKSRKEDLTWMLADTYSYLGARGGSKKDREKGEALAVKFAKAYPRNENGARSVAVARWAQKKYAQALIDAKKANDLSPGDPLTRMVLGVSQYHSRREEEGLSTLKDAYAKYPENFPLGEALAQIRLNRGEYAEAELIVKKLLDVEPKDDLLLQMLAESLEGEGKWREIISTFEPIAAASEKHHDFVLLLSQANRRTDQFEAANRHLTSLIRAEKGGTLRLSNLKMAMYYAERGKLAFDQKKFSESVSHFKKSLALNPSDRSILKFLAGALYRIRNYKEAASAYGDAVRLDPDDAGTRQYHGMALLESGQLDSAEQVFLDTLKRGGESGPVLYYLAKVYEKKGNIAKALEACERSVKAEPNNGNANSLLVKLRAASAGRQ